MNWINFFPQACDSAMIRKYISWCYSSIFMLHCSLKLHLNYKFTWPSWTDQMTQFRPAVLKVKKLPWSVFVEYLCVTLHEILSIKQLIASVEPCVYQPLGFFRKSLSVESFDGLFKWGLKSIISMIYIYIRKTQTFSGSHFFFSRSFSESKCEDRVNCPLPEKEVLEFLWQKVPSALGRCFVSVCISLTGNVFSLVVRYSTTVQHTRKMWQINSLPAFFASLNTFLG